jgi:hypothetical protein
LKRGELDKNLAAYPLESLDRWTSLTGDITTAVLEDSLIQNGVVLVGDVAGESELGGLDLSVLLQRMGLKPETQVVPHFGDANSPTKSRVFLVNLN